MSAVSFVGAFGAVRPPQTTGSPPVHRLSNRIPIRPSERCRWPRVEPGQEQRVSTLSLGFSLLNTTDQDPHVFADAAEAPFGGFLLDECFHIVGK